MSKRSGTTFLAMLSLGPTLGLMIAAIVTYLMPKIYESEAVIEVRSNVSHATNSPAGKQSNMNTNCFPNEFDWFKSRHLCVTLIENLNLKERWKVDEETALQKLKSMIDRKNIHGTDLISIRVRHANKVDARDIAEEVAMAYQSYRNDLAEKDSKRSLFELQKAVKEQELKVEDRRKILATIIHTRGITYTRPEAEQEGGDKPETLLHVKETAVCVNAKRDYEADQELLQTMKLKLIGEDITSKMSMNQVEIHDLPVIGEIPVSPNITLNLLIGFLLGLLLSPLPILLSRRQAPSDTPTEAG